MVSRLVGREVGTGVGDMSEVSAARGIEMLYPVVPINFLPTISRVSSLCNFSERPLYDAVG